MDVQVVVYLTLDEVANILVDGLTIRSHLRTAELDLCLRLEDGLLHIDGDGCHESVADVAILVLAKELLNGAGNVLLEGALVGTALCGVLTIDEGMVFLTILVGMGEGYLDVLTLHVYDGIEAIGCHVVGEQILQTVTTGYAPAVVHDDEPLVEVGVVAQHRLHDVVVELIVTEEFVVAIRLKEDICTVFIG